MSMDEFCELTGAYQENLAKQIRDEFHDKVRNAAYQIIDGKGATYYAVALAVRRIVEAILRDEQSILTVSSLLTGQYGLYDVCLSLPCIVGVNGLEQVLPIHLDEEEMIQLRASAKAHLRRHPDPVRGAVARTGPAFAANRGGEPLSGIPLLCFAPLRKAQIAQQVVRGGGAHLPARKGRPAPVRISAPWAMMSARLGSSPGKARAGAGRSQRRSTQARTSCARSTKPSIFSSQ